MRLLIPPETFAVLDAYASGVGMLWNVGWAGWNPAHPLYAGSMAQLKALGMETPEGLAEARQGV
jgi:hypothetical protein